MWLIDDATLRVERLVLYQQPDKFVDQKKCNSGIFFLNLSRDLTWLRI